ncbi:uncharacterized protein LOC110918539 [Helianthus annuus]|uniref:uncharacterized protein LOC110918539 n=1 Tax=Helianthus annuus TaxID=4232 RepID=UPI000B8F2270|nr:uncharacterized protein LOC110918539 [Helianthus annuus]
MVDTRAQTKKMHDACFPHASMEDSNHQSTEPGAIIGSNDDLLTEILLRLPAPSILRFKSVSKHWLLLLSQIHFTQSLVMGYYFALPGPKAAMVLINIMYLIPPPSSWHSSHPFPEIVALYGLWVWHFIKQIVFATKLFVFFMYGLVWIRIRFRSTRLTQRNGRYLSNLSLRLYPSFATGFTGMELFIGLLYLTIEITGSSK